MSNDTVMLECAGCGKLFKPNARQLVWHYKRCNVRCSECRKPCRQGEDGILVPKELKEKLKEEFYAKAKNN
jgi:hypothetical protein